MKGSKYFRKVVLTFFVLTVTLVVPLSAGEDLRIATPGEEFLIIGHMGAPMHQVENTIPSFKKALDLGANAIETDLCLTSDGEVILWHDWSPHAAIALFRQAGNQGLLARPFNPNLGNPMRRPVPELTLAQFRQNYAYTPRKTGLGTKTKFAARIPSIEEFCAWASGEPRLQRIFFDIKIPDGEPQFVKPLLDRVAKAVKDWDLAGRVFLLSTSHNILAEMEPLASAANLAMVHDQELPAGVILRPSKFSTVAGAKELKLRWGAVGRPVATFLGFTVYKKTLAYDVKLARIHNFYKIEPPIEGIISWTIDKPEEMSEIIRMGISGIMTNRPDLASDLVANWKDQVTSK